MTFASHFFIFLLYFNYIRMNKEVIKLDNILKELDEYVDNFFFGKTPEQIKYYCNKIFNFEHVKDFDKFSKEILALNIEKKIMESIENSHKKMSKNSKWAILKQEAPYIYSNNSLNNYLDLFVRDFNSNNFIKNKEIENFYNNKILMAFKSFGNRLIVLPSGERISINDVIRSFQRLLSSNEITKKEYDIKKKTGSLKKIAAISGIVTITGISALQMQNEKNDINKETTTYVTDIDIKDYSMNKQKDTLIMNTISLKEETKIPVFVGYDNNCPKEYQEYIYEMSIKYDIPFNILMAIADNESNGLFDTNGKISEYDDYGFFQINICNHDLIFKELGYDSKDLLNDPYKNIEAASFLVKKICNMYKEDDYENIFGTYNGWINWKDKETSRNYAANGIQKINEIYNKLDDELFEKEEENERTRK